MATDTQKNYEMISVLKSVINVLEDGQKGMAEIGEHLHDEALKTYFLAELLKRANFRGELENELHRHGVADVHETGTAAGAELSDEPQRRRLPAIAGADYRRDPGA